MQAARSTPNASSARHAVMNHPQTVKGMRISERPLARRSMVVPRKLIADISEPPQKSAMLTTHRVWPNPKPGPATSPTALSGAYDVQPLIEAPPGTNAEASSAIIARNVVQNESMLMVGKAM